MAIGSFNKKKCELCKIVQKTNDNAYMVDLPNSMGISKTFIVADITLFQPYISLGYPENNLRLSFLANGCE